MCTCPSVGILTHVPAWMAAISASASSVVSCSIGFAAGINVRSITLPLIGGLGCRLGGLWCHVIVPLLPVGLDLSPPLLVGGDRVCGAMGWLVVGRSRQGWGPRASRTARERRPSN